MAADEIWSLMKNKMVAARCLTGVMSHNTFTHYVQLVMASNNFACI
ncbi:hypothetical protein N9V62_05385 [Porticoccaceae bacterium]|nr:hypothetical protein [Porticoccaceae bacterium]